MDEIDDSQNEKWRNQNYSYRSPSGEIHYLQLSDFVGYLVKISRDGFGNRFIQKRLETATIEEKNEVFLELKPRALSLMKDKFGNHVIIKFFEHGLDLHRKELAEKLFGHVYTLSFDTYGFRVIQKALEVVDVDQKIKIVRELDNHVDSCLYHLKANHVIKKCVEFVPEEHTGVIVSACIDQIVKLSQLAHGTYIIQNILKYCKNPLTQRGVIDGILSSLVIFTKHGFATYVVQSVVEHGKPEDRSKIVEMLAGNIVEMSLHMFGTKVIEKCLIFGSQCGRKLILNEILGSTDGNEPLQRKELAEKLFGHVYTLSLDQYGCRVIQKALEVADMDQKIKIVRELNNHVETCLYNMKVNNVIQKCVELVPEEHTGVIVSVCIDQIVKLAQHTYGTYIIQTILKYCKDPLTQRGMIDGIVSSVVILANNVFSNNIVQFVLEHGKPEDRSKIIEKLAENIVEVSLNRFGSSVIQKCLVSGSHCDRKLIINVILGSADRNEPFQTIMTSFFGKYVVQTVMQTCDDEQRELILSRIKIHHLEKYVLE